MINKLEEFIDKWHNITYTVEVLLEKVVDKYPDGVEITEKYSEMTTVTTTKGLDDIHRQLSPKYASDTVKYRGFEWTETNTVKKFLDATNYNRGDRYPSVQTLKRAMKKLRLNEDVYIDVMTYFLYDHESK